MKILRKLKDLVFLLTVWPLIMVLCALHWDDELLGGRGE